MLKIHIMRGKISYSTLKKQTEYSRGTKYNIRTRILEKNYSIDVHTVQRMEEVKRLLQNRNRKDGKHSN